MAMLLRSLVMYALGGSLAVHVGNDQDEGVVDQGDIDEEEEWEVFEETDRNGDRVLGFDEVLHMWLTIAAEDAKNEGELAKANALESFAYLAKKKKAGSAEIGANSKLYSFKPLLVSWEKYVENDIFKDHASWIRKERNPFRSHRDYKWCRCESMDPKSKFYDPWCFGLSFKDYLAYKHDGSDTVYAELKEKNHGTVTGNIVRIWLENLGAGIHTQYEAQRGLSIYGDQWIDDLIQSLGREVGGGRLGRKVNIESPEYLNWEFTTSAFVHLHDRIDTLQTFQLYDQDLDGKLDLDDVIRFAHESKNGRAGIFAYFDDDPLKLFKELGGVCKTGSTAECFLTFPAMLEYQHNPTSYYIDPVPYTKPNKGKWTQCYYRDDK